MTVWLYPDVPDTALEGASHKGIAIPPPQSLGGPGLVLAFDTPVMRVVLELEPALVGTLAYTGRTPGFYYGLTGTAYPGTITTAPRVHTRLQRADRHTENCAAPDFSTACGSSRRPTTPTTYWLDQ